MELQLLSARPVALQLGVNERTAQLRAKRAILTGQSTVRVIAGAYVAPLAQWECDWKHKVSAWPFCASTVGYSSSCL
jgi:hypothetical protein